MELVRGTPWIEIEEEFMDFEGGGGRGGAVVEGSLVEG